jgi:acetoacetyl-CoA synthetase
MAVSIFDPQLEVDDDDDNKAAGTPTHPGTAGELVVTAAFPNMPCFFWGDARGAPPGSKYHSSYFDRFKHAWTHGDLCVVHPGTLNLHFLGRSDGVLNPSGIRFGSSEIYTVIESRFAAHVADSLCVGQRRPGDPDERVMLFLLMREGHELTRDLEARIKSVIARELSKRHVPRYIFETPEIPVCCHLPCSLSQSQLECVVKSPH